MSNLMKNLRELYSLQQIDNKIIGNMRRLRQLENTESEIRKRYVEIEESVAKIEVEAKPIQSKAQEIKDENEAHREKKKNCEDRLFNADTDPRDLQYLLKEREQIINLIKKNEDELVRLMVQADTYEIKKRELTDKLEELAPAYEGEQKEHEAEIKQRTAENEELKKKRQVFRDFPDKNLLTKYQQLQKTHDGVAIATISGEGVCDGCYVEVSKATLQRIADAEGIITCQRCGRILYYEEEGA